MRSVPTQLRIGVHDRGEMRLARSAGILLHPTSLPGPGGIGTIGRQAHRFVDFLAASGIENWQILPLGPTGYGDSPYAGLSAFAANPMLLDLHLLVEDGLLTDADLDRLPRGAEGEPVDYGAITPHKMKLLRHAGRQFSRQARPNSAWDDFMSSNAFWVDDFALFMAIKTSYSGAPWEDWGQELRQRAEGALTRAARELVEEVHFHRFTQFVFDRQWRLLKEYSNALGVRIIGDIPIFVAHDSSDVWAHQDQFQLDEDGKPRFVAGVPPDYFSRTGQLWGNPHYRWDAMRDDGFRWWIERFRRLMTLVDVVRVDHFRGFAAAWTVPYGSETAQHGEWVPSPGEELFSTVQSALGELPVIAEDLGVITPDVVELREAFGFPGMKILQFAFGSDARDSSLPHNFEAQTCVYTGTHDNDTTIGWFGGLSEREQAWVCRYLGRRPDDIAWELMRLAFSSVAALAIVPMQDVLRMGTEGRMNVPGTADGNWRWRFSWEQLRHHHPKGLRDLSATFGRRTDQAEAAISDGRA